LGCAAPLWSAVSLVDIQPLSHPDSPECQYHTICGSGPGACVSVPPAVAGGFFSVKIRQLIALTVHDVIHRAFNAAFAPQPPLASFICPGTICVWPTAILPHLPRRICFEGVKCLLRFCVPD